VFPTKRYSLGGVLQLRELDLSVSEQAVL
jgi:hypothetical protein